MSHRLASDRPRTTGWRRAVLGTLGVGGVWVGLTAWQPATTYHLAPAVLAWTAPYLCTTAAASRRDTVLAAALGGLVAAVVSVGLAAAGRLEGPALVGGGPLAESLLVSAGAAVVGVTAALVLPAVTRSPGNHGPGRKQDR